MLFYFAIVVGAVHTLFLGSHHAGVGYLLYTPDLAMLFGWLFVVF